MAKKQHIQYDVNGIQICVGDTIVASDKCYGAPSHKIRKGVVTKINAASVNYKEEGKPANWEYTLNRLYPDKTVLVLEGEFIPKTRCKCGQKATTP